MSKRKAFSLRIDEKVLEAVQRYADDELRSLNAQIEYLLRDALRKAGRSSAQDQPALRSQSDSIAPPEEGLD